MKKIITTVVIISIIIIAFFLIKIYGQNAILELIGQNTKKESIVVSKENKVLNQKIPFFDLSGLDQNRVRLSEYINKPFVVVFWASWNVESVNQLKILSAYNSSLKKEDKLVPVLFVNSQEELNAVKSFVRRGGYDIKTVIDEKGEFTQNLNIKSLPTTFYVDRDGIVREVYAGVLSESMFVDKLEQLLK